MEYKTKSIASRIEWCRRQKTQARTQLEREGWQAEEEGLWDALFNRVHTNKSQHCPPGVFKRYVIGFQDGEALLRAGAVDHYFATSDVTHKTQAGAHGTR
jgi:hypothetical protein